MTRGKDIIQKNWKNKKGFFFLRIQTPFLLDYKLYNIKATLKNTPFVADHNGHKTVIFNRIPLFPQALPRHAKHLVNIIECGVCEWVSRTKFSTVYLLCYNDHKSETHNSSVFPSSLDLEKWLYSVCMYSCIGVRAHVYHAYVWRSSFHLLWNFRYSVFRD